MAAKFKAPVPGEVLENGRTELAEKFDIRPREETDTRLPYGFTAFELIREAFETSRQCGFHDKPKSVMEDLALMHSELSEALEDDRDGRTPREVWYREKDGKPEGIPHELADVVIRVAEFCGRHKIDLESAIINKTAFNRTRPRMHGRAKG